MNQLEEYIEEQQFAAGSMLPKIEAAINFVNTNPKRKTIITSLEKVYEALEEKAVLLFQNRMYACMFKLLCTLLSSKKEWS